jgi:hypothetical protein
VSALLAEKLLQAGVFSDPEISDDQKREQWARGFEIAMLHAQVFNTDAGRRLLDLWIRQLLTGPIVRPYENQRADGIREGRADLVRQILIQLEIAHRGQPGVNNG